MKTYSVTGQVVLGMLDGATAEAMGAFVRGERVSVTVDALDDASAIREAARVAVARSAFRSAEVIRLY